MTVVLADVTITRTTPHCSAVAVTKDLGIGELGGALLTCQDSLDSQSRACIPVGNERSFFVSILLLLHRYAAHSSLSCGLAFRHVFF